MESKLKILKVVELKEILSKAAVSVPAKANKQDLIARIVGSQQATQVYNSLYTASKPPPNDDLLAPPEEVDWNTDDAAIVPAEPQPAAKSTAKPTPLSDIKKPTPAPAKTSTTQATAPTSSKVQANPPPKKLSQTETSATNPEKVDEELEKRKARAARFGIPLVEPAAAKPARAKARAQNGAQLKPVATPSAESPEKLLARAQRFGINTKDSINTATAGASQKRPADNVNEEELERRRKRAERFGLAK